jgi:hypothetical protein
MQRAIVVIQSPSIPRPGSSLKRQTVRAEYPVHNIRNKPWRLTLDLGTTYSWEVSLMRLRLSRFSFLYPPDREREKGVDQRSDG